MKTTDNKNFIVTLNYQWLAYMICLSKKFNFDREKFSDKEILEAFYYYQNTKEALTLLGLILDNIENALELTLYMGNDNYPIKAEIYYRANDCEITDSHGYEDSILTIETQKIRAAYIKEARDLIKYYKEYFLRIYDRSRSSCKGIWLNSINNKC